MTLEELEKRVEALETEQQRTAEEVAIHRHAIDGRATLNPAPEVRTGTGTREPAPQPGEPEHGSKEQAWAYCEDLQRMIEQHTRRRIIPHNLAAKSPYIADLLNKEHMETHPAPQPGEKRVFTKDDGWIIWEGGSCPHAIYCKDLNDAKEKPSPLTPAQVEDVCRDFATWLHNNMVSAKPFTEYRVAEYLAARAGREKA